MKKKIAHISIILILAVAMKFAYVGFAIWVEKTNPNFTFSHTKTGVLEIFKRHDSYWYEKIFKEGYPEIKSLEDLGWHNGADFHQSSWGFMPGYPLLLKITSALFQIGFNEAAFLLAFVFSILAFLLFYWLASVWFKDDELALFSTLLLITFPFHYYFSMMYSEAVFLAALLGSFLAILRKRWFLLALFLSFMVVLKANGILLLIPIGLFMLEQNQVLYKWKIRREAWSFKQLAKLWPLLFPVVVFGYYLYYQYTFTGDAFAYSTAQQGGWYREFMFPLASLFKKSDFTFQFNSYYAILFMLIAILGFKRLSISFNILVWFALLLPMASGNVSALPRYVSIIFPFMLLFGLWLKNMKWKWVLIPLLIGLQLWTFYFWVTNDVFSQ